MKVKLATTILLTLCGVGIGWLSFENLIWGIWGKQNRWFEYVGFWGCPIMLMSGLIALKSLRLGSLLGNVGFGLVLFYLGPALANTLHEIIIGRLSLKASEIAELVLIVVIPLVTLIRMIRNLKLISSQARAEQALEADSQ